MILFDYVFYIFANLYGLAKSEREAGDWRGSGIVISSACHMLFLLVLFTPFLGKEASLLVAFPLSVIEVILTF